MAGQPEKVTITPKGYKNRKEREGFVDASLGILYVYEYSENST
jgi:hypothetical protein